MGGTIYAHMPRCCTSAHEEPTIPTILHRQPSPPLVLMCHRTLLRPAAVLDVPVRDQAAPHCEAIAGRPAFGRAPPTPFSTPYGDGCLEQQPTAGGLDTHAPPLPLPATASTPGSIHHTTPPTTGPHYAPGPRKTGAEKRS